MNPIHFIVRILFLLTTVPILLVRSFSSMYSSMFNPTDQKIGLNYIDLNKYHENHMIALTDRFPMSYDRFNNKMAQKYFFSTSLLDSSSRNYDSYDKDSSISNEINEETYLRRDEDRQDSSCRLENKGIKNDVHDDIHTRLFKFRRAGGRSNVTTRAKAIASSSNEMMKRRIRDLTKTLVPLLLILLVLKAFLHFMVGGGVRSSPSYVYYQSSVYESSTYDRVSGKVERTRKESIRSNIPSMISAQKEEQISEKVEGRQTAGDISSYLLRDFPDQEFDRELDKIFPRTLFDDSFF